MTILITGANGQLGTALKNSNIEATTFFTDIDTLDVCNLEAVFSFVRAYKPDVIINCAAYTNVDRAEDDREKCLDLNCHAVGNLALAAANSGAKVIHYSTDYVFDGHSSKPYREDDLKAPLSFYGQSKSDSEDILMQTCHDCVIIRTSWLYSETGSNFVKTMLRLGAEREEIGVVTDQRGTPTYASDLAAATVSILKAQSFIPGIYHYSNNGECSWYDFAATILELSGAHCRVKPLTTAEYPTRAARPQYSVLDKSKIRQVYGIDPPDWKNSLEKCLNNYKL
jgi:dTDP-4-dehydrorhamnose reductase